MDRTLNAPADRSSFRRITTNLYLRQVAERAWWIFLYRSPVTRRRVEMSLGPVALVTPTKAKELTLRYRVMLLERRCPLTERRAAEAARKAGQASQAPSFAATFERFYAAHQAAWRNAKHRWQWQHTIETFAYPVLGQMPVDRITTGDVTRVLEPMWFEKTETASRLRGRIEATLDYAKSRGWRSGDNPARWKGHLAQLLPAPEKVKPEGHHAALPWQELPALYQKLARDSDVSALALRYTLLTVLRSGEVLGTPPEGEINRAEKVHVIPPARMKAHREHRVPLPAEALGVIDQAEAIRTSQHYLFPGAKGGRLSDMALLMRMRGIYPDRKVTVHGIRSSFRDWASEHQISRELPERQLAHVVRDATERAYLRSDILDPRRAMMTRWAQFLLAGETAAKVIPFQTEEERQAG